MRENHPLIDYGKLNQEIGILRAFYLIEKTKGKYIEPKIMFEKAGELITEKQNLEARLSMQQRLILKPSLDELETTCLMIQEEYR